MTVTPRNPSKIQSSKTLSAPAKQSRKPPPSSDRDELQMSTLEKSPLKLSVQPQRETDNEYKNEVDDDFFSTPQQPCQPVNHVLE